MTAPLSERLGIGEHELISIVGAGGKSTILFSLGNELAEAGRRVILTTTTKMARDQVTDPTCWSVDPSAVEQSLAAGSPLFVAVGTLPEKVTGPTPDGVDRLFLETTASHVVVEADGARSMSVKAPAEHEPVIPSLSTTVIVVAAITAIGHPISEVAHRPKRVAAIARARPTDRLTIDHVARVLLDPNGGLKGIPEAARAAMAIAHADTATRDAAEQLATFLRAHPDIDRVVTLPTE